MRPDHQSVCGALELANRAPSVHNTQPWRWLVGDHSVHLMADRSRQVPATDPDERDLFLSCGAALLAATSLDLATCPLSQPLEVHNTRVRIRNEVLRGAAHPQLVLRVGWVPTSAEPLPLSVRRSLDETVSYLPGTGPRRR